MKPQNTDNDLMFDRSSYVDPHGRVFYSNGKVYRSIQPDSWSFINSLFKNGTVQRLVSLGLIVETTITDKTFIDHPFVLHHHLIDRSSYCVEWPFFLLKKAAIQTLELLLELHSEDLSLQDAYPWNVFFDGTTPVFIDFTSIVPSEPRLLWPAYQQFCQFFLFPLYLYANNQGKVTRSLLRDYLHGVSYQDFEKLLSTRFKMTHPLMYLKRILPEKLGAIANRSEQINSKIITSSKEKYTTGSEKLKKDRLRFYNDLMVDLKAIEIPEEKTRWTNYYEDEAKELKNKLQLVLSVLEKLKPTTVLDVGCNTGEFSIMAATSGASVIALDNDETCVERLARRADELKLKILPLVMDFSNPTPAFGWSANQFPAAPERFKSEMVMALALIHHLVFHQRQNFERIIDGLKNYLGEWLLIEFIDITDSYIQRWSVPFERYGWYTRSNFQDVLNKSFCHVEYVGSVTNTRHLYVCSTSKDI